MSAHRKLRRRALPVVASALVAVLVPAAPAFARPPGPHYDFRLLAKAKPDECFAGVGEPYPAGPPCATGQPKVNQAYVWGLAQVGKKIWFGTGANVNCIVSGATLNLIKPSINDDWVCEYGQSQLAKQNPTLPPSIGDQRAPQVFYYDTKAGKLVDKTADIDSKSSDDAYRRKTTLGLRAGGAFQGVVLLAGPGLGTVINLFAFDGETGEYLGSSSLTTAGNIRHFFVAAGALYAGVGVGRNGDSGGHVLRWTGSRSNPFSFVNVADLPAQAADLTYFNDRLYVSTWPRTSPTGTDQLAGLWMSPPLHGGHPGLRDTDAGGWQQVWNASQYEPDPVIAATYGLGGLAAYNGQLYWGTMHVPMKATTVFETVYPQPQGDATKAAIKNTQRALSVFRGRDFGTGHQRVELLYGESALPAYDPATATWSAKPTGYTPKYGASGFGNPFNNYEWIMTVTAGKLFVGTMDWSYIAHYLLPPGQGNIDPSIYGGDLWAFDCDGPAEAVSTTGVGNYLNYGVRNMIPDGSTVYLGMANPMNLRTDPNDAVPDGGWELIKMNVK
ncbi:hypothetical protein [Dactylosporangium sp. CA-092794]|uniref:hypothetical protein n=1 Tax=Dactylosporangium sp. CA-092794 TaxID=3239929 RepID=UPI003D8CD4E9